MLLALVLVFTNSVDAQCDAATEQAETDCKAGTTSCAACSDDESTGCVSLSRLWGPSVFALVSHSFCHSRGVAFGTHRTTCADKTAQHCAEIACCPSCEAQITAMFACEHALGEGSLCPAGEPLTCEAATSPSAPTADTSAAQRVDVVTLFALVGNLAFAVW